MRATGSTTDTERIGEMEKGDTESEKIWERLLALAERLPIVAAWSSALMNTAKRSVLQ